MIRDHAAAICVGVFWVCLGGGTLAADTNRLAAGVAAFGAAFDQWDYDGFVQAAALFKTEAAETGNSFEASYWEGVAAFHAVLWCDRQGVGGERLTARIDEAVNAIEAALRLRPDDGECHALLSTLAGLQIARQPGTALWRGTYVARHQSMALKHGSANPRVHYLIGCAFYHAPSFWGDKTRAMEHFRKAEALFEQESLVAAGPVEPRWGRSSCLAFMGRLEHEQGNTSAARAYYRKALLANPKDKLAQEGFAQSGGKGEP